jgi:hypothetical protein
MELEMSASLWTLDIHIEYNWDFWYFDIDWFVELFVRQRLDDRLRCIFVSVYMYWDFLFDMWFVPLSS